MIRASRRRVVYGAVTVLLWTLGSVTAMLSVFRDTLQFHFGISIEQFGLLLSIGAVPGAVGAVIGGVLVDRRGPRVVFRVCLVGTALGMAMAGVPGSWVFLLAALAVASFFVYPLGIAAQSYLARIFPQRRRRVLSLALVSLSVGGVAFPLLAEGLLRLHLERPSVPFGHILHAPLAAAGAMLLAGAMLYRKRAALAQSPPADTLSGTRLPEAKTPIPRRKGLEAALLVSLMVIHATCDTSIYWWMPRVLGSQGLAPHVFAPGAVMAAYSVAYIVSRGMLSVVPEDWGRRAMLIVPGPIGGAVVLAGVLSHSQVWMSVGYVAAAFCWSLEYPALLATLAGDGSRRFGSALGVLTVATGLSTFAVANIMGVVGKALGESSLWIILLVPASGFPLVGLGGLLYVWRFGRATATQSRQEG